MTLKQVTLRGTKATEGILDWVATSAKGGIAVACDGDGQRECAVSVAQLKPNGKSGPLRSLGHDNASAVIAWPDGETGSRRPKPTGVLVVASRVGERLSLHSGRILPNGRLKGGLEEQADLNIGDVFDATAHVVQATMFGDRVGVVVSYKHKEVTTNQSVSFYLLTTSGRLIEGPVELTHGRSADVAVTLFDIVGNSDGWHVLAGHAPFDTTVPRQLLAWTIPPGATADTVDSRTVVAKTVPEKALNASLRGTFVRGLTPLTVLYDEDVRWETAEARRRRVGTTETTRFLTAFEGSARRAPTRVAVETWDRVAEFWDRSATSTADLAERTSTAIPNAKDHVFAVQRSLTRHVPGLSNVERRQQYSVYRLDPRSGQSELLSVTERQEQPGVASPIRINRFGKLTAVLFNYEFSLGEVALPLMASF